MISLGNALTLAIAVIGIVVVAVMYNAFQPDASAGGAPTPTPAHTLPPLVTPTPTALPPPISGHVPAIRTAWIGYAPQTPCDTQVADVLYLPQMCQLTDAMIDAGRSVALGVPTVHLPGCPGSGGNPLGRYAILVPDGGVGPTLAAFPGDIDEDSPQYRDLTYPAPEIVLLDSLDQRHAFVAQARIVHYHSLPYRVYLSAYPVSCRILAGAALTLSPHPVPTPTPTPMPTPTNTPEPPTS